MPIFRSGEEKRSYWSKRRNEQNLLFLKPRSVAYQQCIHGNEGDIDVDEGGVKVVHPLVRHWTCSFEGLREGREAPPFWRLATDVIKVTEWVFPPGATPQPGGPPGGPPRSPCYARGPTKEPPGGPLTDPNPRAGKTKVEEQSIIQAQENNIDRDQPKMKTQWSKTYPRNLSCSSKYRIESWSKFQLSNFSMEPDEQEPKTPKPVCGRKDMYSHL